MKPITSNMFKSISSGQKKQIMRFALDAIEKALDECSFDKESAQRIIHRGDELNTLMEETAEKIFEKLSVFGQYASEEVKSNYTYPKKYQVKPLADQVATLRKLFPQLDTVDLRVAEGKLPEGAEGWFAIPRWEKIAPTYPEAIAKVLEAIKASRTFHNWYERKIDADHIRQSKRSEEFWTKLGDQQKSDILIVPAQFGLRHRGRSVRRALEMFSEIEFGIGAFAGAICLLTHPERLERYEDLWLDLAGDEVSPGAVGSFSCAPIFGFSDGEVGLGAGGFDGSSGRYGAMSGFLPQY